MNQFEYSFEAPLSTYDFGEFAYSVVYLPKSLLARLDFSKSKRLRIYGEINGVPKEAAIMPAKGKWYIMVSKKLQKQCRLAQGDLVSVVFDIADPESVSVPRELQFALEANDAAMAAWNALTAGKRRGFCFRVSSAKRIETKERRVAEIVDSLLGT